MVARNGQDSVKLFLLTDPKTLRQLADIAEDKGRSIHRIEQPDCASGIDEIVIEVLKEGGTKENLEYMATLKHNASDIIQVHTL